MSEKENNNSPESKCNSLYGVIDKPFTGGVFIFKDMERLKHKKKTWQLLQKENIEKIKDENKKKTEEGILIDLKICINIDTYKTQSARLKNVYNITVKEYHQMIKDQNGCCAICGTPQSELKRKLVIDHDHDTGKVRGLLCYHCNTGIGFFKDDFFIYEQITKYLQKYKQIN